VSTTKGETARDADQRNTDLAGSPFPPLFPHSLLGVELSLESKPPEKPRGKKKANSR
jgi:hypothetical protein